LQITMYLKERLNQLRMVYTRVIQYHDDFLIRIPLNHFLQKGQKHLGIVLFSFYAKYVACFIIQSAEKLHATMFAVGRDLFLLTFGKPGMSQGLVIPDHGFIFKQDSINFVLKQFFLPLQSRI